MKKKAFNWGQINSQSKILKKYWTNSIENTYSDHRSKRAKGLKTIWPPLPFPPPPLLKSVILSSTFRSFWKLLGFIFQGFSQFFQLLVHFIFIFCLCLCLCFSFCAFYGLFKRDLTIINKRKKHIFFYKIYKSTSLPQWVSISLELSPPRMHSEPCVTKTFAYSLKPCIEYDLWMRHQNMFFQDDFKVISSVHKILLLY